MLFTFIFTLLFLGSCVKEYYTDEIYTDEIYVSPMTKDYIVHVNVSQWTLANDPPTAEDPNEDSYWTYFYYEFPAPALTEEVFDYGIMNAYLVIDEDVVSPLPFDDYYMNPAGFMWTEHVTCEFSPGKIRFIVKYNDFGVDIFPREYTFMVRFMW